MRKNIPASVKIGRRFKFKIVWVDDLGKSKNGRNVYGETSFNPNIIKLRKDQDDHDAVKTYFHEFLHTTNMFKKGQNLSENQVMKLESRFEFFNDMVLQLNGIDVNVKKGITYKKEYLNEK